MKVYKIEVEEILQNVYEIEANSLEEAIDKAEEMYRNEEIVLDYEAWKETNYREYEDVVEKDKKKNKEYER
ncbi:MAG: DpnD protein [Clostridiales bacterium]|nr:DpnD protein [Clostridiales bacterium]